MEKHEGYGGTVGCSGICCMPLYYGLDVTDLFIPASNEPGGHACTSIRRMPQGSMPRLLAVGLLTNTMIDKTVLEKKRYIERC